MALDAARPGAGRGRPDGRHPAPGARAIEPRATGTQARLRGRRTAGEAVGRPGVDPELRARARAAPVADGGAHEGPTDAQTGPAPEPAGGGAGRNPTPTLHACTEAPRPWSPAA